MDDQIYDLENKIEMLREQPETTGFMKNRLNVYNIGDTRFNGLYNVCTSNGAYVSGPLFKRAIVMKKIKDELSASDYETLQYTTYESSKETIEKYIEILNRLVDKSIFDIPQPKIPPCPNEINDDDIPLQFQSSDKVKLRVDHDLTKTPCKQSFDHDPSVTITFVHINCDLDKIKPLFVDSSNKPLFIGGNAYLTKEKIEFSALISDVCQRPRFMTKLLTTLIEDVKTSPNVSDDDQNGTDYTGPLMSIRFNNIDSFDVAKRIHDTFIGDKDYINNNIILTINESDVSITTCIDNIHSMLYDLACELINLIVNTTPGESE